VAVVLLAGCGETPPDEATGQAAAAAERPVVFRRGLGEEPDSLDPQRSEAAGTADLLRDLFEGLTATGPGQALVPAAARDWTVSEDGRVYGFRLRPEGRWSNGDPVVAEDFAVALRRAVDPATGSSYGAILSPIEHAADIIAGRRPAADLGVTATGEHELEIRLVAPTSYFLALLSNPVAFPVHRPTLAAYGNAFARVGRLVSNGPFRLVEWTVNERVKVERNPFFREAAAVAIDSVIYYPLDEPAAELQRYRADELDFTESIPNSRFAWLREQFGDELVVAPYLGVYYYMFNLHRPPFDDPRLRRALSMVVDRELLVERVTGVGELPAFSFVPPGVRDYEPAALSWRTATREERWAEARRLYEEAGFRDDRPLRFELIYNTGGNHRKIALAIASMWKEALGVEVKTVNMELRVMLERRRDPEAWVVMRLGWVGDFDDAHNFLSLMTSTNAQNDTGFADPEYDALLAAAALETDPRRRAGLLREAETRLLDASPILPIYFYVTKHLVKPWVKGYEPNILDHNYSRYLRIDTAARGD
jgi:oligopeptide transport system substrate-binding protein